jgi:DNA-binding transcriptional regulator YbjK
VNFKGFSQKRALTTDGDTVVIFSIPQAKKMLKVYYEAQECKELQVVNDSIISAQDKIIQAQIQSISYADTTIMYKDSVIYSQKEEIRLYRKQIIKEKKQKRLIGAGGIVGIILAAIFL